MCEKATISNSELAAQIIQMETAALEKWNMGNPDGYLSLYAQDFTYFDPMLERRLDGFDAIKEMYEKARGQVKVEKYEMIHPNVQIYGNTATLTFSLLSWAGSNLWKWNCTEVYALQSDNSWKIVHNHWSLTQPLGINL